MQAEERHFGSLTSNIQKIIEKEMKEILRHEK